MRADDPVVAASGRTVSFVRDLDVEVGQGNRLGDPKVDLLFDGFRAGVDIVPMIDGRLLLRVGVQKAAIEEPMELRAVGPQDLGALHLPEVRVGECLFAAAIADGGGVVVGGGAPHCRTWLITAESLWESAVPPEVLPVAPLGVADMPAMGVRGLPAMPGDDASLFGPAPPEPEDPIDRLDVVLGGVLRDETTDAVRVASCLVVPDPDLRRTIEAGLRSIAAESATWRLEVRWGSVPAADLPASAAEAAGDSLAGRLESASVLATLVGQPFSAAFGIERSYIRDYDVEISGTASAGNPVLGRLFAGFSLAGSLRPRAGGRIAFEGHARWTRDRRTPPVDLGMKELGELHLADLAVVEGRGAWALPEGRWQLLGATADPERAGQAFVIAMRATR